MRTVCSFALSAIALLSPAVTQTPTPTTATTPPLDDARMAELQRLLRPDPNATWRTIPWQTDLLAAQHTAADAHRPLFVWAMDGHPLGCT